MIDSRQSSGRSAPGLVAWVFLLGIVSAACAGASTGTHPSETPDQAPGHNGKAHGPCASSEIQCPAGTAEPTPLPRYFTLTVDGPDAFVSGSKIEGKALSRLIAEEASDSSNAGAAIVLQPEFSGETLGALVWELSTAGFHHIVVSKPDEAVAEITETPSAPILPSPQQESVAEAPAPKPEPEEPPADSDVEVKHLGLHIGGGPNDEPTKARYTGPISERFADFQRCHKLLRDSARQASVGVDLLIPSRGGHAQVKDFRTSLQGGDFKECATAIFEKVRFPGSGKPMMISYSLLFKPVH